MKTNNNSYNNLLITENDKLNYLNSNINYSINDSLDNSIDFEPINACPGWGCQLLQTARFAHSKSYIELLAIKFQFKIVKMEEIILRRETSVPIYGVLYLLSNCLD